LKLPQLLSQFLYQTKKLDLPGIGSFVLDPAAVLPEESDRGMQTAASGISFSNANIKNPDSDLIAFLQLHTGKMKPLAAADLDFFLTSGRQLLNIGKAFYLDGIGTLLQNKDGKLDFTPGQYSTDRLEEQGPGKKERTEKRNPDAGESNHHQESRSNNMRQLVLLAGIIGGLAIIGWGGYTLYKRNTLPEPQATITAPLKQDPAPVQADTTLRDSSRRGDSPANKPASVPTVTGATAKVPAGPVSSPPPTPPPVVTSPPVSSFDPNAILYKFVILQTSKKGHALRRYNQLLGFQLNIKMDQKDSSYFKLFFPISANRRDTTHIKDSLADVYGAHVTIER
jgi:hypothetical protein